MLRRYVFGFPLSLLSLYSVDLYSRYMDGFALMTVGSILLFCCFPGKQQRA